MKLILKGMCAAAAASALMLGSSCSKSQHENPFMKPYETEYQIPPFDKIEISDYMPAFEAGIAEANARIDSIIANPEAPTFENTIEPLSCLSPTLDRVMSVLMALVEADSTPELTEVSEKIMPLYTAFADNMMMNQELFKRVQTVYNAIDTVNQPLDERRAIEETYREFERCGATLPADKQEQLKKINATLTDLYLKFNKNLLAANNAFEIIVDNEADLAGIPQNTRDNAAAEAESRGHKGKWAFTLHAPSRLAVLQYAENRDLREKMWKGYTTNATSGEFDNRPLIGQIVKARAEKACIMGYPDFAAYMTADKMARTPQAAEELLMKVWEPAKAKVAEEVAEMQALSDSMGNDFKIAPWDYYYFAEKVRQKKYALDESAIRPYFAVDSVRKGIFEMANRLYGITFRPIVVPVYHEEVSAYEVLDSDDSHLGVLYFDFHPRAGKGQGAWCGNYVEQSYRDGERVAPVVSIVCNFTRPTASTPALLTLDEAETLFHEFGHALHFLFLPHRPAVFQKPKA